jgi:hypothetical protein
MADCSYHPGKEAVGACVSCGKMVCIACRTELQEKVYCQPCANKLFIHKAEAQPAKVETVVAAAPAIQSVSGWWWLLPIFFTWLGGIIAWAANKNKDPKKAKSMLVWGIVLAVIFGIIWAVIIILFTVGILVFSGQE